MPLTPQTDKSESSKFSVTRYAPSGNPITLLYRAPSLDPAKLYLNRAPSLEPYKETFAHKAAPLHCKGAVRHIYVKQPNGSGKVSRQ